MPKKRRKAALRNIPPASGKVVADLEVCHQCGICEMVCSLYHEGAFSPSFSRISLSRNPFTGEGVVEVCRQCAYPDCYFVCPVDAITIDDETGARVIVQEECNGCGKCAQSCPFNEKDTILRHSSKDKVYLKCDLCQGKEIPECVANCPNEALVYMEVPNGSSRVENPVTKPTQ